MAQFSCFFVFTKKIPDRSAYNSTGMPYIVSVCRKTSRYPRRHSFRHTYRAVIFPVASSIKP
jgi:hypothetical protein